MNQEQILSEIDAAPNGEVDEQQLFAQAPFGQGAANLTNLLAQMRREGLIVRERREGSLRVYKRAVPGGGS